MKKVVLSVILIIITTGLISCTSAKEKAESNVKRMSNEQIEVCKKATNAIIEAMKSLKLAEAMYGGLANASGLNKDSVIKGMKNQIETKKSTWGEPLTPDDIKFLQAKIVSFERFYGKTDDDLKFKVFNICADVYYGIK